MTARSAIIETARSLAQGHNLRLRGCISKPLTKPKLDAVFLAETTPAAPAGPAQTLDAGTLSRLYKTGGIVPYFQPQIAVRTGKIVGAEALVRGEDEELGHLGAYELVSAGRAHNMMGELTDIMARKTFEQLSSWQRQGLQVDVALNIDPQQLCELDLPDRLSSLARELDVRPASIIVEVTEESLNDSVLQVMDVLARLRMKGFRTSSDDFGTGRSNIDMLQSLPFTEMKLDRSYVSRALTHSFADVAIQTAVKLAKVSGLELVAEGIETQEQIRYLVDLKVDVLQGYLFAKPMPAALFEAWYRGQDGYVSADLFRTERVPATLPVA